MINPLTEKPMESVVNVTEDTFLVEAVASNQATQAMKMVREALDNPRFKVNYKVGPVQEALADGDYPGLGMFYHHLVIPEEQLDWKVVEMIKQVFTVEAVINGYNNEVIFEIYLDEGPYASTVKTAIYEINEGIGALAEAKAQQIGLEDYTLTFNISHFYM